jgi:hypothetical protein
MSLADVDISSSGKTTIQNRIVSTAKKRSPLLLHKKKIILTKDFGTRASALPMEVGGSWRSLNFCKKEFCHDIYGNLFTNHFEMWEG